jgi:hypothetical protein
LLLGARAMFDRWISLPAVLVFLLAFSTAPACSEPSLPSPSPSAGARGGVGGTGGAALAGAGGAPMSEGGASHAGAPGGLGGAPGGEAGMSQGIAGAEEAGAGGTAGAGGASDAGSGGEDSEAVPEIPRIDESELPEPERQVGFIELEPAAYSAPLEYQNPDLQSGRARLFYSFIPADTEAKDKPLFVMFNGGPGATSMYLYTLGTGPLTLDAQDFNVDPIPNERSFTSLGNLLYIDSRGAGFSYNLADDPTAQSERAAAADIGSYNPAVDGADFVRVVLGVMRKIPAIRNNPVVLLGESYGGVRAGVMLAIATAVRDRPGPTQLYADAALEAELDEHFQAVFPGVPPERLDPRARAKQFGWQVLIQPLIAGETQNRAMEAIYEDELARMAAEAGLTPAELAAERCRFDSSEPQAWCDQMTDAVSRAVTAPSTFTALMGIAPELVPGLRAAERGTAFRFVEVRSSTEQSALVGALGELASWDSYYELFSSRSAPLAFTTAIDQNLYGWFFAQTLRYTHTLITNARWDTVILSEAIVPALRTLFDTASPRLITDARFVPPSEEGERPTRFVVEFADVEGFTGPHQREVFFPTYANSGHYVTAKEGAKLRDDIAAFLAETGLGSSP